MSLSVFVSYAHEDEPLKKRLRQQLAAMERRGLISVWDDRAIPAGGNWEAAILERLASADILLLLISSSFIASDYCYGEEMNRALQRHLAGEALLVPILVRPCQWQMLPFIEDHKIQMVPRDGKPVTGTNDWPSEDKALEVVATELAAVVQARRGAAAEPPPAAGGPDFRPGRPDIPRLLPDLCNRADQDTAFDIALRASLARDTRRPFVFVLYGDDVERHHGFRDRLAQVGIPRVLNLDRAQTSVECLALDSPSLAVYREPHEAFRAELGNKLLDNRTAPATELFAYVCGHPLPILMTSLFVGSDTLERLRKLIPAMLAFWAQWPDMPSDRCLLHCLSVRFERPGDAAAPAEDAARDDIRKFLRRLAGKEGGFREHANVAGAVLPELASVSRADVERWADSREVQKFSRIHPEDVAAMFQRAARRKADGSIPMEYLYKDIYQLAVERRS
jgi:hypothetical protein